MRKTFTIWLLLGALLLSLFGNVLVVSAQAVDQEDTKLTVNSDNSPKSDEEQQLDSEADDPRLEEDKKTTGEAENGTGLEATDPVVDQNTGSSENEQIDVAGVDADANDADANLTDEDLTDVTETDTADEEVAADENTPEEGSITEEGSTDTPAEDENTVAEDAEADATDVDLESEQANPSDDTEVEESSATEDESDNEPEETEETAQEDATQDKEPEEDKANPLEIIPQVLAQTEAGQVVKQVVKKTVESFDALTEALNDAAEEIWIVITKSFEITETLKIEEGKNITLTADNSREAEGDWEHIKQPADYANWGEEKQREIIEEARRRGDEALEHGDLEKNPLPNEDGNIILKRAQDFLNSPLFRVYGTLTLGTVKTAVYVDGNNKSGSLFEVSGTLNLENGVLMHAKGNSAPVNVQNEGIFNMNGGRISQNLNRSGAGAVEVNPGGTFTLNNGLIDNNTGGDVGAIFAGNFDGSDQNCATIKMKGGEIVNNVAGEESQGGAITLGPKSTLDLTDGIIAGNKAQVGGGIAVTDKFITYFSNTIGSENVKIAPDEDIPNGEGLTRYEKHLLTHLAKADLNGGLFYSNTSSTSGGGIYVESNHVNLGKTMLLQNEAGRYGGGIYVSFVPVTQKLQNVLITENTATGGLETLSGLDCGLGGGLWNCPIGFDHFGDRHSLYIYGNSAKSIRDEDYYGADLALLAKHMLTFKGEGELKPDGTRDDKRVLNYFYSLISPVTAKGNLIKFLEDGKDRDNTTIPEALSYAGTLPRLWYKDIFLKADYSEDLIKEAWSNSHTFIMYNTAKNGGGIGSNANLYCPNDEGDHDIRVEKNWDVSTGGPAAHENDKVIADIFIVPNDVDEAYVRALYGQDKRLIKYGEVRLDVDNGWQSSFAEQQIPKLLPGYEFDWSPYLDTELPQDKGLYFTPEMLRAKGLKYLVMERDQDYARVVDEKPASNTTVEKGKIRVTMRYIKNDDYDKYINSGAKVFLYHYDKKIKRFNLLAEEQFTENTDNISVELAAELLKGKINIEYYGEDRPFYKWGNEYLEFGPGHDPLEEGFALVLVDNPDGSRTLKVPYFWIQNQDVEGTNDDDRRGIKVDFLDPVLEKQNYDHTYTLTNYSFGDAEIEKKWDKSVDPNKIPETVTFTLLLDGQPVVETYDSHGKPVYKTITVTKQNGWKGCLGGLNSLYLEKGNYSLREENNPDFEVKIIRDKENAAEENIEFWILYMSRYYEALNSKEYRFSDDLLHKDLMSSINKSNPIYLNLRVDGELVDTCIFYWDKVVHPIYPSIVNFFNNNDNAKFKVPAINLGGYDIAFDYYDVLVDDDRGINEWGRMSYDILLEKNERGIYSLRLPRLIYQGKPYLFFYVKRTRDFSFDGNKIPHTQPVKYTFTATNYPKPTPPPPPEEPPEEPPYEPPTLRFSKPTLPPPTTRELIRLLPATSCVQADAKPTTKSATELVEKVWSELKLAELARGLFGALRKAA